MRLSPFDRPHSTHSTHSTLSPFDPFDPHSTRGDGLRRQRRRGRAKSELIARQVLADMIESGEEVPEPLKVGR